MPDTAKEDTQSEMSEGEFREREEKAEELGDELFGGVNEVRSEVRSKERIHMLGVD
jgi:hypothetical protein